MARNFLRGIAPWLLRTFALIAGPRGAAVRLPVQVAGVDSTFGRLGAEVTHTGEALNVGGHTMPVFAQRSPDQFPWGELGVDLVIESTGKLRTRDDAGLHLKAGAKRVLISSPGKGVDATLVPGVNADSYDPVAHQIISGASCTTNCVAPLVKVLHEAFDIKHGYLTTVHAYTNDQNVLDAPHKDPRRAWAAGVNIIPTSTGAAEAVGLVLPELAGRLDGVALRVPVVDGSISDLNLQLATEVTAEQVNATVEQAAAVRGSMHGIIRFTRAPIVSTDIVGDPASCVFDAQLKASVIAGCEAQGNAQGFPYRPGDSPTPAMKVQVTASRHRSSSPRTVAGLQPTTAPTTGFYAACAGSKENAASRCWSDAGNARSYEHEATPDRRHRRRRAPPDSLRIRRVRFPAAWSSVWMGVKFGWSGYHPRRWHHAPGAQQMAGDNQLQEMTKMASNRGNDTTSVARNRTHGEETKPSFKTTELVVYVLAVIGVLVASAVTGDAGTDNGGDVFAADKAWWLITLLTIGYMVSRGLAKAGSRSSDTDPRTDSHNH